MATGEGLSPEQIDELLERFDSFQGAAWTAMQNPRYADELRFAGGRIVPANNEGRPAFVAWPLHGENAVLFWKLVWAATKDARGKRGGATGGTRNPRRASELGSSRRGRRKGEVSIEECNKAGRVYFKHKGASDYEIWQRYRQGRVGESGLLSKNMVGHLCIALHEGWLPWTDRGGGRLLVSRISGDFRTSRETLVIPRDKPAG